MNDISLLHLLVFVSTSFVVPVFLGVGEISPKGKHLEHRYCGGAFSS